MSTEQQLDEITNYHQKRCPFCLQTYIYFCRRCFSVLYCHYLSQKYCNLMYDLIQHSLLYVASKQLFMSNTSTFEADLYHAIIQQYFILLLDPKKGSLNKGQEVPALQPKKTLSSHSVKSKKSSRFLTALVRRTKKKIKTSPHTTEVNLHCIPSDSSFIPLEDVNEIELRCQNYEKCSEILEEKIELISSTKSSDHSIPSTKKKTGFLKKILRKSSKEEMKKKSDHSFSIQTDFLDDGTWHDSDCEVLSSGQEKCQNIVVPSSYINFSKPHLSPSLLSGLQVVQDMTNNLKENENHLMELIMKHIKDQDFQRDLLNSFAHHSKLQWEAERRASVLANEMWLQQIEIGKTQEKTLQETLNSVVKQNRQLQIENESMYRKYEKLLKKIMTYTEAGLKPKNINMESQMNRIVKNNQKLQHMIEIYIKQNENLEGELHLMQNQNNCLEKQLRTCNAQLQNLKGRIPKLRTDYELELLSLNTKLQLKEQTITTATEAGEALLSDLDSLKRQFKGTPLTLNITKFKCRSSCITELVHMSKACINELAKELMSLYTQLMLKEKDMGTIRETNEKLQESLQKSATELQNVSKKLEDTSANQDTKFKSAVEKCKAYEIEVNNFRNKVEELKTRFEVEKADLLKKISEQEQKINESSTKDTILEQSKRFITNISAENFALKSQLDSMNKLLMETGAGDVERKLQSSNEQAAFYHSRYLEIFDENQKLMLQVDSLSEENRHFKDRYDNENHSIKKQLQDLEQENCILKQKLEDEHHTVLTLQTERMKYLDEKNLFKSIYQHLKAELVRYHKLEEVITIMSKEAGHFALIAEYNKKVGDQLKAEVEEKNSKILELRNSVEKLNELQIQNTKEKLSLCYELSEVCNLKKQTESILSLEIQRNKELDHKKKELVDSASSQIHKIEEREKNERTALKILLKDVKILFDEKNNLMILNEKITKENEEIKRMFEKSETECNTLRSEIKNISSDLQTKTAQLSENENIINEMKQKIKYEIDIYNSNALHLESTINQLEGEKCKLQDSVKYLQNTTQKLQKELDEIRETEQEMRFALNQSLEEKKELEKKTIEENAKLSHDKVALTREIEYLNKICDKVLSDFEVTIRTTEEKENMFRKELEESKYILAENTAEMGKFVRLISKKDAFAEKLGIENEKLRNDLKKIERERKQFDRKHRQVLNEYENQNRILENINIKLGKLQHEYEAAGNYIRSLEQEKLVIGKEIEDDRILYKKHVDELARKCGEYEEEISALQSQLTDQYRKMENEKSAYGTLACLHKEISTKFMKIVKEMVEIKNDRQEALNKSSKLSEEVTKLKAEKDALEETAIKFQDEAKYYEKLHKQCLEKRMSLEREITTKHLQAPSEHEDMLANCQKHQTIVASLEKDLRDSYNTIDELKQTIHEYRRQITDLELQRSEMNLKLHEIQRKLTTEQSLCEQLRNTHKLILAAVLEMKEGGRVDPTDGSLLLSMVKSSADNSTTASNESLQMSARRIEDNPQKDETLKNTL